MDRGRRSGIGRRVGGDDLGARAAAAIRRIPDGDLPVLETLRGPEGARGVRGGMALGSRSASAASGERPSRLSLFFPWVRRFEVF